VTPPPPGVQLRLVIPPRGPVGRLVELTGINRYVPIYPTLQFAADASRLPAGSPAAAAPPARQQDAAERDGC